MSIDEILRCDDNNIAFDNLKELVDENLRHACMPFSFYFNIEFDKLFETFKYDYRSLLTISMFNVLNDLSAELSKGFTRVKLIRDTIDELQGSDENVRKRLERFLDNFEERNERHLNYLIILMTFHLVFVILTGITISCYAIFLL